MNRFLLTLLCSPTLLGSMLSVLAVVKPAHAAEIVFEAPESPSCVRTPNKLELTCVRVVSPTNVAKPAPDKVQSSDDETAMLDFTEEESDAAAARYGCDCPACIRALRLWRTEQPST